MLNSILIFYDNSKLLDIISVIPGISSVTINLLILSHGSFVVNLQISKIWLHSLISSSDDFDSSELAPSTNFSFLICVWIDTVSEMLDTIKISSLSLFDKFILLDSSLDLYFSFPLWFILRNINFIKLCDF